MALLISAASAGEQGGFGSGAATLASGGILNVTVSATWSFGNNARVTNGNLAASNIAFDHASPNLVPPPTATNFRFGGAILAVAVSAGDQSAFGGTEAANAAQSATPEPMPAGAVGKNTVVLAAPSIQPVNFDHDATQPEDFRGHARFDFGPLGMFGVGLGDQSAFGLPEAIAPVQLRPEGIAPPAMPEGLRAGPGTGAVIFNHTAISAAFLPLRFDFGSPPAGRPVMAIGSDTSEWGAASVENAAQGAFAAGHDSATIGNNTVVYLPTTYSFRLDFSFVVSNTEPNAQNIAFQFIEASGFGPTPWDSLEMGTPQLAGLASYLDAQGDDAAAVGSPAVGFHIGVSGEDFSQFGDTLASTADGIAGVGFETTEFGGLSLSMQVRPESWDGLLLGAAGCVYEQTISVTGIPSTLAHGQPTAYLFHQFIEPGGFEAGALGSAGVQTDQYAAGAGAIPPGAVGIPNFRPGLRADGIPPGLTFGTASLARTITASAGNTARFGAATAYRIPYPQEQVIESPYRASWDQRPELEHGYSVSFRELSSEAAQLPSAWGDSAVRYGDARYAWVSQFDSSSSHHIDWAATPAITGARDVLWQLKPVFFGVQRTSWRASFGVQNMPRLAWETLLYAQDENGLSWDQPARLDDRYAASWRGAHPLPVSPGLLWDGGAHPFIELELEWTDAVYPPYVLSARYISLDHDEDQYRGGIKPGGVGTPSLRNQQFIDLDVYGIEPPEFGELEVQTTHRLIEAESVDPPAISTTHRIWDRVRYIEVNAIYQIQFGAPLVGREQEIAPAGLDAAQYGLPGVQDNTRRAYPEPASNGEAFGTVWASNFERHINAFTVGIATEFGPEVRLTRLRDYIAPYTDTTATWGPHFGHWTLIENRDKAIGPYGFNAAYVTPPVVENKAVPIKPAGFTGAVGELFIAYGLRYIAPETLGDAGFIPRYHTLHNDARVLAPPGFNAAFVSGGADVLNLNRTFRQEYSYTGEQFGTAFIADGTRYIVPYQGIPANEPLPQPHVYNLAQYVAPVGYKWRDETGAPAVHEHFNIIAPRFVYVDRLGGPTVRNLTPEIGVLGYGMDVYGTATVRLQFRFVEPEGAVTTLAGKPNLTRGIRYITMTGSHTLRMGTNMRVELADPGLPSTRTLLPVQIPALVELLPGYIGKPSIRDNVLRPEGIEPPDFGLTAATGNSIYPRSIWILPSLAFGQASFNQPTVISDAGGIPAPFETPDQPGAGGGPNSHDLSPRTIWCRFDAPQAARANHGDTVWRYMDQKGASDDGKRPFFGAPVISNQHRTVQAHGHPMSTMPEEHRVSVFSQYVQPTGSRLLRMGYPYLFGGDRSFQAHGFQHTEWGDQTAISYYVAPNVTQTVTVSGLDAGQFGANRANNFHREIYPAGADTATVPWVRVGPPPRAYPMGEDEALYGVPFIDHKIRTLHPSGIYSLDMRFGIYEASKRMRVRHRDYITPAGFVTTETGSALVAESQRSIAPRSARSSLSFGVTTMDSLAVISLGGHGTDHSTFGDVDKWEAGKAKPYGPDMATYGVPTLSRGINSVGLEGEVGTPSIGRLVTAESIGDSGVTMPAVSLVNPHGCGQLPRAVHVHQFVGHAVGVPSVS